MSSHISEGSIQSIQHPLQERFLCKDSFEKTSYIFNTSFLSEWRIKENCFQQIQQLYLSNVFLVRNSLIQNFTKWIHDIANQFEAENLVINIIYHRFQQFYSTCVNTCIAFVEINTHTFYSYTLNIFHTKYNKYINIGHPLLCRVLSFVLWILHLQRCGQNRLFLQWWRLHWESLGLVLGLG